MLVSELLEYCERGFAMENDAPVLDLIVTKHGSRPTVPGEVWHHSAGRRHGGPRRPVTRPAQRACVPADGPRHGEALSSGLDAQLVEPTLRPDARGEQGDRHSRAGALRGRLGVGSPLRPLLRRPVRRGLIHQYRPRSYLLVHGLRGGGPAGIRAVAGDGHRRLVGQAPGRSADRRDLWRPGMVSEWACWWAARLAPCRPSGTGISRRPLPTFLQNRASYEKSGIRRTTIAERWAQREQRRTQAGAWSPGCWSSTWAAPWTCSASTRATT